MDQPPAGEGKLSVLVADDQPLVRDLILTLLAQQPDMSVEGAEDLPGVLARIAAHGPFDVLLLDFFMPGVEGLAGVESAIAANRGRPVLLMSGNLSPDLVEGARRLGVRGFLPKTRFSEIAAAVRNAATVPGLPPVPPTAGSDPDLTDAERTILRDLVEGRPNEAMAARLGDGDLESQLRQIFSKLGVRSRAQAVLAAKRLGIIA